MDERFALYTDAANAKALRAAGAGASLDPGCAGASAPPHGRRLRRDPCLYRPQSAARRRAPARGVAGGRDACESQPASNSAPLPAFDRPSLQRRTKQRRLSADHRDDDAGICRSRASVSASASSRPRRRGGDFEVLAERRRRALRVHIKDGAQLSSRLADRHRGGGPGGALASGGTANAARNDRPRPDGRQHRAPSDAPWPSLGRLRHERQAVHGLAVKGASASRHLADFVRQLDQPRAVWVMLPAGAITDATIVELSGLLDRRRHHHRRRQFLLQGRRPPRRDAERQADPLCRCRHVRAASGVWSAAIA